MAGLNLPYPIWLGRLKYHLLHRALTSSGPSFGGPCKCGSPWLTNAWKNDRRCSALSCCSAPCCCTACCSSEMPALAATAAAWVVGPGKQCHGGQDGITDVVKSSAASSRRVRSSQAGETAAQDALFDCRAPNQLQHSATTSRQADQAMGNTSVAHSQPCSISHLPQAVAALPASQVLAPQIPPTQQCPLHVLLPLARQPIPWPQPTLPPPQTLLRLSSPARCQAALRGCRNR